MTVDVARYSHVAVSHLISLITQFSRFYCALSLCFTVTADTWLGYWGNRVSSRPKNGVELFDDIRDCFLLLYTSHWEILRDDPCSCRGVQSAILQTGQTFKEPQGIESSSEFLPARSPRCPRHIRNSVTQFSPSTERIACIFRPIWSS